MGERWMVIKKERKERLKKTIAILGVAPLVGWKAREGGKKREEAKEEESRAAAREGGKENVIAVPEPNPHLPPLLLVVAMVVCLFLFFLVKFIISPSFFFSKCSLPTPSTCPFLACGCVRVRND